MLEIPFLEAKWHVAAPHLGPALRVGFSIQNLTGLPIRYLQHWEGGRRTVEYINHGERGLLNFIASMTLIRNNQIVEEPFDVQLDRIDGDHNKGKKKAVGNRVSIQVAGFCWLANLQVDELGCRFEEITPVLGRQRHFKRENSGIVSNALRLVTEVVPFNGGRLLRLRSVFTIKNNTRHTIKILTKDDGNLHIPCEGDGDDESRQLTSKIGPSGASGESDDDQNAFLLNPNEIENVPLSLLYRSLVNADNLGSLYICPAELDHVQSELSLHSNTRLKSVAYSTDPINLHQVISLANNSSNSNPNEDDKSRNKNILQLRCELEMDFHNIFAGPHLGSFNMRTFQNDNEMSNVASKIPPFCYNIEIIRESDDFLNVESGSVEHDNANNDSLSLSKLFFPGQEKAMQAENSPASYMILIHPPILLENLLPREAYFEIIHSAHKRVLWSSWLAAGTAVPIHSVTLDQPLTLLVNVNYCRTSEGFPFHQPNISKKKISSTRSESTDSETAVIILSDAVGQRLLLNVENNEGGGGQRHLIIYCPFWIVNTSQYSFRIREEGSANLPAGTVTAQKYVLLN